VLTTSLLVRNVSYRVRPDELKRIFSRYGDVRDVYIPEVCIMIYDSFYILVENECSYYDFYNRLIHLYSNL